MKKSFFLATSLLLIPVGTSHGMQRTRKMKRIMHKKRQDKKNNNFLDQAIKRVDDALKSNQKLKPYPAPTKKYRNPLIQGSKNRTRSKKRNSKKPRVENQNSTRYCFFFEKTKQSILTLEEKKRLENFKNSCKVKATQKKINELYNNLKKLEKKYTSQNK